MMNNGVIYLDEREQQERREKREWREWVHEQQERCEIRIKNEKKEYIEKNRRQILSDIGELSFEKLYEIDAKLFEVKHDVEINKLFEYDFNKTRENIEKFSEEYKDNVHIKELTETYHMRNIHERRR